MALSDSKALSGTRLTPWLANCPGRGYQTEMIGKLHLNPKRKRYGFDHMQLADATRGDHNDYVEWLQQYHNRNEVHPGMAHGISSNGWIGRPHHLPEEQMHTFWCID